MKYLLLIPALLLTACSDFDADIESIKDMGKQEIVKDCQSQNYFEFGILKFECHQLWVLAHIDSYPGGNE